MYRNLNSLRNEYFDNDSVLRDDGRKNDSALRLIRPETPFDAAVEHPCMNKE